jgi:hypothetical protein
MDRRQHEHQHGIRNGHPAYHPAQAHAPHTLGFTEAWLKYGESLNLLQRSGYAVLSLLFVAFGLYLLWAFVITFRAGDWISVLIFGGAMSLFLTWGVKGLRNVLRFPPER